MAEELIPHLCMRMFLKYNSFLYIYIFGAYCIDTQNREKDLCSSYKPIYLLNIDSKILSKILVNWLGKVITSVIHPDNLVLCLIDPLQWTWGIYSGSRIIVSLDSAKAFDKIKWLYLWETLKAFSWGPTFLSWIQLLYKAVRLKLV